MAVTAEQLQAWLDRLDEAIASGATSVRDADGKAVTYRTLSEMTSIANSLRRRLGQSSRPGAILAQARRGD